jgi:hypothetical protein
MKPIKKPAQIPHNLHCFGAMGVFARRLPMCHVAADTRFRLVGAVGIEFIKAQNLKELCGMCCSRKLFVVLGRNYCCPRIAPAFL